MAKATKLLTLLTCLYLITSLATPHTALANTDPKTSTAPVSATIPALSLSSDSQAPSAPVLIRPVDSTITSDPRPELVWRRSQDEGSNTVFYTVYLDGIATYLGVSDLGNSSGLGYSARIDTSEVKLLPTSALAEGSHSWYITAEDLSGNRRSSATWHFTVDLTPPILSLESLEDISKPKLESSPVFTFPGPQDIEFAIQTEPYATLFITFVNSEGITVGTLSTTTSSSGIYTGSYPLPLGRYSVLVSSLDRGNLSSSLPTFTLDLSSSRPSPTPEVTGPLPPTPLPSKISLPPLNLKELPATIAKISSQGKFSQIIIGLIAVTCSYLLVLLWRRRYNLYLVDSNSSPLTKLKVYHSLPPHQAHCYLPDSHGRLYIPHLNQYSTLTFVNTDINSPLPPKLVTSLSVKLSVYRLTL